MDSETSPLIEADPDLSGDVFAPESGQAQDFAEAVLAGLSRRPRSIPCRYFYDARGSALFEEITALDEYYLTRTETVLLESCGEGIASVAGRVQTLVEFGSGSSRKTSLLLDALGEVETYIPIDIAPESLDAAAARLSRRYKRLAIKPLIADFTAISAMPPLQAEGTALGVFLGSTIGNFTRAEARTFLTGVARLLGPDSAFLVGVDLKKSERRLVEAYNDASGVTAAFNLNLLARINRELRGTFNLAHFAHKAIWSPEAGRIEMYLVSLAEQIVHVAGRGFSFAKAERIHTESAHKYSAAEFQALAAEAGWRPTKTWVDQDRLFSLHLLRI